MCRGYWAMRALAVSGRKFERGLIGGGLPYLIRYELSGRNSKALPRSTSYLGVGRDGRLSS